MSLLYTVISFLCVSPEDFNLFERHGEISPLCTDSLCKCLHYPALDQAKASIAELKIPEFRSPGLRIPDLRSPELGNLHDSGSQNLLKLPIWITEAHILAKEAKVRSKDRTQPCTLQYGMQALQVAWCSDDCATPPPPEIANTGVFFPLPSTSLLLRKRQFTVYTVCVMCSCLEPEVLAAGEETTFLF